MILFPLAGGSETTTEAAMQSIPNIQILIKSGMNLQQFRDLAANTMNKLVRIPGNTFLEPPNSKQVIAFLISVLSR